MLKKFPVGGVVVQSDYSVSSLSLRDKEREREKIEIELDINIMPCNIGLL